MAPAPIDKKITVVNGENENPPIHVPNIAGEPAIRPNKTSFGIIDLQFDSGAAIARPSVVLCKAKPIIRNVPSAACPNAIAAPTARPSPKL